jgi:hypothetical protein
MKNLHLIVHKSMIEDCIKEGGGGHSMNKLKSVLRYIEKVEKSEENVKQILFGKDNYPWPGTVNQILDICKGYPKVILYGIDRTCCVKWAKEDLERAGIETIIDEQGVI